MNSRMFKHFLVVAAAFLLVASVVSAETNAPLLPTQSGAMPAGPATSATAQPPAPSKAVFAPSKAVSPAPSKDVSPAPSKAVSPAPSKDVSPAPSKAVSPAPSKDVSPAPSKGVVAQPPAISTPSKLVEASAADMETGSDEDFEALADMHDEEVEDADAEEDSDLDGVSAARAVLYFALKFIILYCLNFASDITDEDLEDESIFNGRIHGQYCGAGYVLTCPMCKVFFIIMHLKSIQ
jgi:hypothetical protein